MRILKPFILVFTALTLVAVPAAAQIEKGAPCPEFNAVDIHGDPVSVESVIKQEPKPYLLILFFFSLGMGDEAADKLRRLHEKYGDETLKIVALGMEAEEAALKDFAARMGILYQIVDADTLDNAGWINQVSSLPLTLFVAANESRRIERLIVGGGATRAELLKELAETLYQQHKAEAVEVAELAIESGEDEFGAREVMGFYHLAEGKLAEAEEEFGQIDSKVGLAKVAIERGDYDRALSLAEQAAADPGFAGTVKAEALLHKGEMEAAEEALKSAEGNSEEGWRESTNRNLQGRVAQEKGSLDSALSEYQEAVSLDPYNVIALSNEGAAYRARGKEGDLDRARQRLEEAASIRQDEMVAAMLRQVVQEQQEANDVKRGELIRAQIATLKERYEELKEQGMAEPVDSWTTRPLILALLPGTGAGDVFFTRAGTDIVVQRELEMRLDSDDRVNVVEREMLDQLLQELDLGSSDLARADTQRRLGQVLSAGLLGFMDFAQVGLEKKLYLRLVDTETTEIEFNKSYAIDEDRPTQPLDTIVNELLEDVVEGRDLKGLIADAAADDAIVINLGAKHGVEARQEFTVYVEGEPIEVGGRVLAHRQQPVAKLVVKTVNEDYAICEAQSKREGVTLAKEMKIKRTS